MTETEKMLTLQEIAQYMGVSKKTVMTWIYDGRLIAFKLDKTFRVSQENFKKFLDENSNLS
jgi:excisionase family DNA binding protein